MSLRVKVVGASDNRLACYWAEGGARNRTRQVVYRMMFGRVRDFWFMHIGLGINVGDIEVLIESEYEDLMLEQDEEDMMDQRVVEISDDSDNENAIYEGGIEGEAVEDEM